jgi:hypothetical protein
MASKSEIDWALKCRGWSEGGKEVLKPSVNAKKKCQLIGTFAHDINTAV